MKKFIVILCFPVQFFASDNEQQLVLYDLSKALEHKLDNYQGHDDYPFTPTNTAQNSPNNSPPNSPNSLPLSSSPEFSETLLADLSVPNQVTMQYPAHNQLEQNGDQELVELQEDSSSDPFWNSVYACAVFVSMYFYFSH